MDNGYSKYANEFMEITNITFYLHLRLKSFRRSCSMPSWLGTVLHCTESSLINTDVFNNVISHIVRHDLLQNIPNHESHNVNYYGPM
jgi:hypothetical protein